MPAGAALGVAGLGAGANLLGSFMSSDAAKSAAKTQANSAQAGLNVMQQEFNQSRADLQPYRDVGAGATTTLAQLYGIQTPGNPNPTPFGAAAEQAFTNSPDYKFAFDQGNQAVQFAAAANGQLTSGNTMRDLTTFGQGLATQNFGNYANRLLQLSQMGQSAATTGAGQANQFGQAAANQYGNIGEANASGIVGSANAWNTGLSSTANNLMLYNMLRMQPQYAGGGGGGSGPVGSYGSYGSSWQPSVTV